MQTGRAAFFQVGPAESRPPPMPESPALGMADGGATASAMAGVDNSLSTASFLMAGATPKRETAR